MQEEIKKMKVQKKEEKGKMQEEIKKLKEELIKRDEIIQLNAIKFEIKIFIVFRLKK